MLKDLEVSAVHKVVRHDKGVPLRANWADNTNVRRPERLERLHCDTYGAVVALGLLVP